MAKKVLTQFSAHANTIADTFRAAFVKTKVGECAVEMTAPEESTKGGLYGLQHLTLREPDGRAIMVGTVHAGEKKAELRTWALVSRIYEERFKKPPSFTESQYEAFIHKAEPILGAFALDIAQVETAPEPPKSAKALDAEDDIPSIPPAARKRRLVTWILFVVALVAIIGGGVYTWRTYIKR